MAFRMNYVGELGWELHHPIEYQNHIFDALMEAWCRISVEAVRHPARWMRCGWRSPTAW
jgi:glycine cleavage system aminomethyltransferase T